ncbi:MAG TPA: LuxR C-terminal-related transcriptional regulator [Rhizobacter sp.]
MQAAEVSPGPLPVHPPVCAAKLRPMLLPASAVRRDALVARIDAASRARLLAVVAPAGSGKTTSLSQWHDSVRGERQVAWLSLDALIVRQAHVFTYLQAALQAAGVTLPEALPTADSLGVAMLLDTLDRAPQGLCIVVDGFEALHEDGNGQGLIRAVEYLVLNSPAHVHWIVASRCAPGLCVSQLQLSDQCVVLGARDLAFTPQELAALGQTLHRRTLAEAEIAGVMATTEGWCAGAKLAFRALGPHAPATADRFTGAHRSVVRYFDEVLLCDLPEETQRLLVRCAVVDRLNGALCNALTGDEGGYALLDRLEQSEFFLIPLDEQRQWYRLHALLLGYARDRLAREQADAIPSLHLKASRWFLAQGLKDEALTHALAAQDRAWLVEAMDTCAVDWIREGDPLVVMRWVAHLSTDEIVARDEICCAYILSLVLSHRLVEARRILYLARHHPGREHNEVVQYRFRVLHRLICGDVFGKQESVEGYLEGDQMPDPFFTGVLIAAQATSLLGRNRFDEARRMALRARDIGVRCVTPYLTSHTETLLCAAEYQQGNLRTAARISARNYAALKGAPHSPAWVNAAVTLACARYERGRLDAARALLLELIPHVAMCSTPWVYCAAHVVLARLMAMEGRFEEATELLGVAHSVLDDVGHPRYLAEICYEKVRLGLEANDAMLADSTAASFGLREREGQGEWSAPRHYEEAWARCGSAAALLALNVGEHERARAMLQVIRDSADGAGRVARRMSLDFALAVCHWSAGHDKLAHEVLRRSLSHDHKAGFSRAVFDDVPRFAAFMRGAFAAGKLEMALPARRLKEWLGLTPAPLALPVAQGPAGASVLPAREPLSDRELEVLQLLAKGLCNKSISRASGMALNTIKWHLRNLYAKLDATNRTSAVARGRELQLVP